MKYMSKIKIIRNRHADLLEIEVNRFVECHRVFDVQFQASVTDRCTEYAVMIVYGEGKNADEI